MSKILTVEQAQSNTISGKVIIKFEYSNFKLENQYAIGKEVPSWKISFDKRYKDGVIVDKKLMKTKYFVFVETELA